MTAKGFGVHIPEVGAPIVTAVIIGYFYMKSSKAIRKNALKDMKRLVEID